MTVPVIGGGEGRRGRGEEGGRGRREMGRGGTGEGGGGGVELHKDISRYGIVREMLF